MHNIQQTSSEWLETGAVLGGGEYYSVQQLFYEKETAT